MNYLSAFQPMAILFTFIGVVTGIVFGCIPGLTGTMGIVLMLPLTYKLDAVPAFALLMGIYVGAEYGGSISAILIRTPGTGSAAATVLDGNALARKGHASEALGAANIGSFSGGIISCIILIFLAPKLASVALSFGPPEYFAIGLFGLSIVAGLASKNLLKGILGACLGVAFSFVGLDPMVGSARFTFGQRILLQGITSGALLLGIFAMAEIFMALDELHSNKKIERIELKGAAHVKWPVIRKNIPNLLRSSLIGTVIGIIPATGTGIAAWLSYNEAKRASKEPETFGTGNISGVFAPEAGNNGVTGGALVPLLTLGIPGDVVTAAMMGALLIQGLTPGPKLFTENRDFVTGIYVMLIIANLLMLLLGQTCAQYFAKVLKVPTNILMPIILLFCIVGGFAINNDTFNILVALILGLFGYICKKVEIPPAPVLLGLLLGPIVESNFRRAMSMSRGDASIFFTRPISLVFIIVSVLSCAWPFISDMIEKRKQAKQGEGVNND